jgi:hypothetical protein
MAELPQRLLDQNTRRQLAEQVEIVVRNLNSVYEIGKALLAIRDQKLYRLDYKTFDDFCKEKFGFGRTKAKGLIANYVPMKLATSQVSVMPQNGITETIEVDNSASQTKSAAGDTKKGSEEPKNENSANSQIDSARLKDLAEENEPRSEEESDLSLDGWGIPIQPHAAKAFEACAKFDELISHLKQADKLFSEIAELPGGAYLRRPGVAINSRDRWKSQHIGTALLNAKDCKPTYTVCPRAYHAAAFPDSGHVHGDNCTLCHGLNWSRPLGKNEVQPEAIAAAKEAFLV